MQTGAVHSLKLSDHCKKPQAAPPTWQGGDEVSLPQPGAKQRGLTLYPREVEGARHISFETILNNNYSKCESKILSTDNKEDNRAK